MRQGILVILFFLISFKLFPQEGISVGLYGGSSHYMGDYNKTNPLYSPSFSYGFVFKNDFNKRYTIKYLMVKDNLSGNIADFEDFNYPENQIEKTSFNSSFWDISVSMEFNFQPYDVFNIRKENLTPFVFLGVGTAYFTSDENFNFPLTIPFGLGIKYNIFERFSIGLELDFRKTFFDNMDGVNTIRGDISKIHNDDWYHMGLIFFTYKPFARKIKCPTYED